MSCYAFPILIGAIAPTPIGCDSFRTPFLGGFTLLRFRHPPQGHQDLRFTHGSHHDVPQVEVVLPLIEALLCLGEGFAEDLCLPVWRTNDVRLRNFHEIFHEIINPPLRVTIRCTTLLVSQRCVRVCAQDRSVFIT